METSVQFTIHKNHWPGFKLLLFLLWLATTFSFSMHLFTQGFFLRRSVVNNRSTIIYPLLGDEAKSADNFSVNGIWKPNEATFAKAVLIIVDALRYDFLTLNETLPVDEERPYQNKLKIVHSILKENPGHGHIYKFVADPPTTTMQRIKGFTTGGLPTFLDMANNFGSDVVEEDNILEQLRKNAKSLSFVGDDTWMDLYPKAFDKAIPCPSFNVKDLDTVDSQVIHHLPEMLKNGSFDFMIGHCLGIDHCGHTFGPLHKRMAEKLVQMDRFISEIMKTIDNRTLLVVIGDHGMTATGDHGGDSEDEINAGLLLYANRIWLNQNTEGGRVEQIDLVPTLSLLLGIPIPFSNLGSIITDVFGSDKLFFMSRTCNRECKELKIKSNVLRALHANSLQVLNFIKEYEIRSGTFQHSGESLVPYGKNVTNSIASGVGFDHIWNTADDIQVLDKAIKRHSTFLCHVKRTCKQIWATFDVGKIIQGLIFSTILIMAWILLIVYHSKNVDLMKTFELGLFGIVSFILLLVCILLLLIKSAEYTLLQHSLLVLCIVSFFCGRPRIFCGWQWTKFLHSITFDSTSQFLQNCPSVILLGAYCMLVFSNSYVVYEDQVLTFMLQSMIFIQAARSVSNWLKDKAVLRGQLKSSKDEQHWNKHFPWIVFFIMLALMCNCLTMYLRECREEQSGCQSSRFTLKLLTLIQISSEFAHTRLSAAVLLLIGTYTCLYFYLKKKGNIAEMHSLAWTVKIFLPFLLSCLVFHWILQSFPNPKLYTLFHLEYIHQIILPRIIYLIVFCSLVFLIRDPCGLYVFNKKATGEKNRLETLTDMDDDNLKVQAIFQHLNSEMQKQYIEDGISDTQADETGNSSLPMVFGLGTVYSAAFLVFIMIVSVVLLIAIGDGASVGFILHLAIGICSIHCTEVDSHQSILERVIFWSFLCSHGFYATGHQPAISAVKFDAGFLGIDYDGKAVLLPALLVFISTFAAHIVNAMFVPLLLIWNTNRIYKKRDKEGTEEQQEEMVKYQHKETTASFLFEVASMYMVVRMIKLVSIATAAAVHRRHLMVWKIFAPRFLFEACGFIAGVPFLCLGILLFIRIDTSLRTFLQTLE